MLHACRIVVLGTVQLHHQHCFGTIEIHNIAVKNALPSELHRVKAKEFVPEKIFFFGGILP